LSKGSITPGSCEHKNGRAGLKLRATWPTNDWLWLFAAPTLCRCPARKLRHRAKASQRTIFVRLFLSSTSKMWNNERILSNQQGRT